MCIRDRYMGINVKKQILTRNHKYAQRSRVMKPDEYTKPSKSFRSLIGTILNVVSICLGSFEFGVGIGIFNTLYDTLFVQLGWNTPDDQKLYSGLVNSLMAAAALVASFVCGPIMASAGRRKTLLLADMITLIGTGIQIIGSTATLLIGRIVYGLAVGFNSAVIPLYIAEISPVELSGMTGAFHHIFICVGILFSFLMGFGNPKPTDPEIQTTNWWRVMVGFPIIVSCLRLFIFLLFYRYDSPTYLVSKGKYEEAELVLKQIYNADNASTKLSQLQEAQKRQDETAGVTFGTLFGREYRKALFFGCFISFLQQCSGMNAIMFYSTIIFKGGRTGDEAQAEATMYTAILGVILVASAFLCGVVIDKGGRRSLLFYGEIILTVVLFAFGILGFVDEVTVQKFLILAFVFFFGMTLGPVTWIYIGEILPDKGISIAIAVNWLSTLAVAQGFQILSDTAITINGCFIIFGVVCLSGIIFSGGFVVETKGKNKQEIQRMFAGERNLIGGDESPSPQVAISFFVLIEKHMFCQDLWGFFIYIMHLTKHA
eukprot:TRINITY_DN642_c0_g1_i3.p1 TRINITY_DN642_c0_g1~~TRINITY_DN642_c0_g1_i3.p1  ORF type:complete len:543 (+),score=73.47 TRINITY_DN642_c0_g1_i3:74-1702(+)